MYVKIFILNNPKILETLREKVLENVYVSILCQKLLETFNFPKCSNLSLTKFVSRSGVKAHKKLLLTDRRYCLFSTANFSDTNQKDVNLTVCATSSQLHYALNLSRPTVCPIGGSIVRYYPIGRTHCDGSNIICNILTRACKSIQLGMHILSHPEVIKLLLKLKHSGIRVTVILDPKALQQPELPESQRRLMQKLDMQIWNGEGMLHCKFCLIDKKIAIVSSANWTILGLTKNQEDLLVLEDLNKEHKEQLLTFWNNIQSNTIPLSRYEANNSNLVLTEKSSDCEASTSEETSSSISKRK
ncbi:MAG: hypothetical protein IJ490_00065 [Chlamydia sp.]|nr:hypothetical protein [Chlamydia sp.]